MADTKIVPFLFEGEQMVRTIESGGAPWFVLADVCRALEISEAHRAAARLDEDEKGRHTVTTPGGNQEVVIINESGLYSLVLTSRKDAAKRFKKWVTAEVLPALRQTGRYDLDQRPNGSSRIAWADRSNEDRRVELETIAAYRRCCSTAAAWWYAQEHAGLPTPPRALQPIWRQSELMQIEMVSVTVMQAAS